MSVPAPNAMDFSGFAALRAGAANNDPETLREVARQFESLFTSMMLKNMRAASFGDPLLGGSEQESYRDMFDQQIAVEMSRGRGLGIADMLVRQLSGTVQSNLGGEAIPRAARGGARAPVEAGAESEADPAGFIRALTPLARAAGEALGVDPRAIVAQAALETGWGRHMPGDEGGRRSHNLFGIKAGAEWRGERVSAQTLEFESGALRRRTADFRAYDSMAESLRDYVRFMRDNPRYRDALAAGTDGHAYARGLQAAGYATDPDYAAKLIAIMDASPLRDADTALKISSAPPITDGDAVQAASRVSRAQVTRT